MSDAFVILHGANFRVFRASVLGATQVEFAGLTGLSVPSIQQIERQASYRLRSARATKIAAALGVPVSEFIEIFGVTDWRSSIASVSDRPWVKALVSRLLFKRNGRTEPTFELDRDEPKVLQVRSVPYFDFCVPAGGWSEGHDGRCFGDADGRVLVPQEIPSNAFSIRIRGDSMVPDFPDGSIIVFAPILPGENGRRFQPGVPYYVEHEDGRCTFKVVNYEPARRRYRLDSLNKKYKPLNVPERDMARLSRAILLVRDLS